MTFKHIHREEAPNVGEPDDMSTGELHGEAPPCEWCGERPRMPDRDICETCAKNTNGVPEREEQ